MDTLNNKATVESGGRNCMVRVSLDSTPEKIREIMLECVYHRSRRRKIGTAMCSKNVKRGKGIKDYIDTVKILC